MSQFSSITSATASILCMHGDGLYVPVYRDALGRNHCGWICIGRLRHISGRVIPGGKHCTLIVDAPADREKMEGYIPTTESPCLVLAGIIEFCDECAEFDHARRSIILKSGAEDPGNGYEVIFQ